MVAADTIGVSPYCPQPQEALLRLGFDVRIPLPESNYICSRLLPLAAANGYHAALRQAFDYGEAEPGDAESQMRWLARHLHIEAPSVDAPWPAFDRAWEQAHIEAGLSAAPAVLEEHARRVLLETLLELPEYKRRLEDALVAAFLAAEPQSLPPTLEPSVDIDVEFYDTDDVSAGEAAATLQPEFEEFLKTIPGQAEGRAPAVEFVEDEDAVYLRGTIWLAAYDESLAAAASERVRVFASTRSLSWLIHF
jgi:hypothetical protein